MDSLNPEFKTDGGLLIELRVADNGFYKFNCKNGYLPVTLRDKFFTGRAKAEQALTLYLKSKDRFDTAVYPDKVSKIPTPPLRSKNSKIYKEWEAKYGEEYRKETLQDV